MQPINSSSAKLVKNAANNAGSSPFSFCISTEKKYISTNTRDKLVKYLNNFVNSILPRPSTKFRINRNNRTKSGSQSSLSSSFVSLVLPINCNECLIINNNCKMFLQTYCRGTLRALSAFINISGRIISRNC